MEASAREYGLFYSFGANPDIFQRMQTFNTEIGERSQQRGLVEARHLWAKIKAGSRESLAEEQGSPLLAQRAPPADSEALDELAAQLKGHISTQAAKGHVRRIWEWEERIRRAWTEKPSEVYKGVRETAPGRTVFLKRSDGTLTGNWAEMQELAQGAWTSQVYCKLGRPTVDVPAVVEKYRGHLEARRVPLTLLPLTAEDLKATLGGWPAD